MNRPQDEVSQELQDLVAAACEGELTDRETERLEQLLLDSAEARRYYLLYLHLHGELHWHQAMSGEMPDLAAPSAEGKGMAVPAPALSQPKPDRISRLRLIGFCISALLAVTLLGLAYRAMPDRKRPPSPAPPVASAAATLTGAVQPRWTPGSAPPVIGQAFPLDRQLVLERGVIEIAHSDKTRILLEGPATFRCMPGSRIELDSGKATIVTTGPPDLIVQAGDAEIEPSTGAIGLLVADATVEVHSLDGQAKVRRVRAGQDALQETVFDLATRDAITWNTASSDPPMHINSVPDQFALTLPDRHPTHSVARMRSVVANHSRLIHHYPFEGTSRLEKCQDRRGALHLTEAVMVSGRGRGILNYTARGFDLTTEAIQPHREPTGGNENGVALQSEVRFRPPTDMTIELLLKYHTPEDVDDETVALAVATRDGQRNCGFYVAAVGRGNLCLLLDGQADWVETGTVLTDEHWYYVAVTFEAGEATTIVNAYATDLTGGQRTLKRMLDQQEVPGVPAMSRLGIGKGFDYSGAHAYPWSGELDEVAVYDAVLDQQELQTHVNVLRAGGTGSD